VNAREQKKSATPGQRRQHREREALPEQPQPDVENRNQCDARRKTYQHKFRSVLQHFSEDSVRSPGGAIVEKRPAQARPGLSQ
jgi:hypothetical protein